MLQLFEYSSSTSVHLNPSQRAPQEVATTNAEQCAATFACHNRLGFFALYVTSEKNRILPTSQFLLRPTQLVYGKLKALLCASFLVLSSVHSVWQHKLSTPNGIDILVFRAVASVGPGGARPPPKKLLAPPTGLG